ncbi:MAG: response regulator transcription factor [Betaproteobacteria bacterium]
MEASLKIENILRHSRAASIAPPVIGRIFYVGRPFAQWTEIRRNLGDRNLDVRDAGALPDAAELAQIDLVVVGHSSGLRESHETCGDIRRLGFQGPILLLTHADDTVGRILGLESGADAWCAADADARSLVAQIRALIRREQTHRVIQSPSKLRAGKFVLDSASREVAIDQERFDLTTLEFELLWNLAQYAGEIMSRERLAQLMGYDSGSLEGRAIDTAVARLRNHLGRVHAAQIRTIRGVGYMLCVHSMFELQAQ